MPSPLLCFLLASKITYRNCTGRIQLHDLRLLELRVLIESIPHVCIRDASVFPHEPKHLPSATRLEVEVVHCGHAADLFVGSTGFAEGVGSGHFECLRRGDEEGVAVFEDVEVVKHENEEIGVSVLEVREV